MFQSDNLHRFSKTLQATDKWIAEMKQRLDTDEDRAFRALRASLHAIRDNLTVEEVADFGSQLPVLLRGVYYEGFRPADVPARDRHAADFLRRLESELFPPADPAPTEAARASFEVISGHLTEGEVRHLLIMMHKEVEPILTGKAPRH